MLFRSRIEAHGESATVTLPDASQAALHGLLDQLRAHRVPLVSVSQAQPDLEEVFLRLIHPGCEGARAGTAAGRVT